MRTSEHPQYGRACADQSLSVDATLMEEGDKEDPRMGSISPHVGGSLVILFSYYVLYFLNSARQRVGPQQVLS